MPRKKPFLKQSTLTKTPADLPIESQIFEAMRADGLTYEAFAEKIGSFKGNVYRDLHSRGLGKASLDRIHKMANALDMEFVPLLLPRNEAQRKKLVLELLTNL